MSQEYIRHNLCRQLIHERFFFSLVAEDELREEQIERDLRNVYIPKRNLRKYIHIANYSEVLGCPYRITLGNIIAVCNYLKAALILILF